MQVTPPPDPVQIIAGLQSQTAEFSRGFRPGGTRDWLLVATLGGLGYVKAGNARQVLRHGDLLLIAPNTPQDYGYLEDDSGWHNIWVHVRPRPHWAPWMKWPEQSGGIMILHAGPGFGPVEVALRGVLDAASASIRLRNDLAMNALERALILCDALKPLQSQSKQDPRIVKAIQFIGENLEATHSVDILSRAVGLSRSRFSTLFRAQTALSLQSYIEGQRLARGAQMLALTGWPVGQIAREVGYEDPYYFSTRFRLQYGIPPKVYRLQTTGV